MILIITKIKCNRLKPSCEACQVFNCACIYGALSRVNVGVAIDVYVQMLFQKREALRLMSLKHF